MNRSKTARPAQPTTMSSAEALAAALDATRALQRLGLTAAQASAAVTSALYYAGRHDVNLAIEFAIESGFSA